MIIKVNESKCQGCGTCIDACHVDAVMVGVGSANIDEKACTQCGVCVMMCPMKAIERIKQPGVSLFVPVCVCKNNNSSPDFPLSLTPSKKRDIAEKREECEEFDHQWNYAF